MAQVDFTVTQNQYDAMMVVLDGIRAKLSSNKVVLTKILSQETGLVKVKAFALTDEGQWLLEVKKVKDDLVDYFDSVGWKD